MLRQRTQSQRQCPSERDQRNTFSTFAATLVSCMPLHTQVHRSGRSPCLRSPSMCCGSCRYRCSLAVLLLLPLNPDDEARAAPNSAPTSHACRTINLTISVAQTACSSDQPLDALHIVPKLRHRVPFIHPSRPLEGQPTEHWVKTPYKRTKLSNCRTAPPAQGASF